MPDRPMILLTDLMERVVGGIKFFADPDKAFGVALLIMLLALVLGVWSFASHLRFKRPLVKVIRALGQDNPASSQGVRIQQADDVIQSTSLDRLWPPYRAAIRPDPVRNGCYVNLIDPHEWFSASRLPGRGYETWASTAAGVFLTVGLLFTFIGLSAALLHAGEAARDSSQMREAINGILEASSAKFITSIAGILCYIAWTITARIYVDRQATLAGILAVRLQRLTTFATPEMLLYQQAELAQQQTDRLKTLADDVAVALGRKLAPQLDAIPVAFDKALMPVTSALQNMGSLSERSEAAMQVMMDRAVSAIGEAAGTEMQATVAAMGAAATALRDANSGIGQSGAAFSGQLAQAAQAMEDAAGRVAAALGSRTEAMEGSAVRFETLLTAGAQSIAGLGPQVSAALEAGVQRVHAASAEAAAELAATMQKEGAAVIAGVQSGLHETLAPLTQRLVQLERALADTGDTIRQQVAELGQAGGTMTAASQSLRQAAEPMTAMLRTQQALAEAANSTLQSFESVSASVTAATGALKLTSDSAAEAFRSYVERFAEVDQQFAGFVANVRDKVGELGDDMNKAVRSADGEMGDAVKLISTAIVELKEAVEALHDAPPITPSTRP